MPLRKGGEVKTERATRNGSEPAMPANDLFAWGISASFCSLLTYRIEAQACDCAALAAMVTSVPQKVDTHIPEVRGSELKSVSFYRSREPRLRFDVAPFYVIYPAVVFILLGRTFSGAGY